LIGFQPIGHEIVRNQIDSREELNLSLFAWAALCLVQLAMLPTHPVAFFFELYFSAAAASAAGLDTKLFLRSLFWK